MNPPETVLPRTRADIGDEIRAANLLHRRMRDAGNIIFTALRDDRPIPLHRFEELAYELAESAYRNPSALMLCSHANNSDSYTHAMGTGTLMVLLAEHLQMSENEICQGGIAGLLHDIGNFHVQPQLLNKPGTLTPEEFQAMARHTMHGAQLLAKADYTPTADVRDSVRHHHERLDGSGYPDKIADTEIPRLTRMTALADAFDALTRDRPFHKAMTVSAALDRLHESAPGKLDAALLDQFAECIGPYPAGSLVRLGSQRLAVVMEQRPEQPHAPLVDVFYDVATHRQVPLEMVDLAGTGEQILSAERPADWNVDLPLVLRKALTLH